MALENITIPPDLSSLDYNARRNYADVYKLVDMILPIAAGSSSPEVQKDLLKIRYKMMHNKPLEKMLSWPALKQSIDNLPKPTS